MNFIHVPGVQYLAGVTFQSEYGVHEAGTVVKEATKFQNLASLVDNHFLWPYAPDAGYEYLPPHLYNSVQTMDEVKAALEGDPYGKRSVEQFPNGKPEVVARAEFEAEMQPIIRAKLQATSQPGAPKDSGPTPEEVAEEATASRRVTKRTAKSTTKEKS
jgi:hypothetical protein